MQQCYNMIIIKSKKAEKMYIYTVKPNTYFLYTGKAKKIQLVLWKAYYLS